VAEFQPPYCLESAGHHAQLFRQAISTLVGADGGVVAADSLEVTPHEPANMSVDINGGAPPAGEIWVPGTSSPGSQGSYFCWNDGVVTRAIGASDEGDPRIDTVVARVFDSQYAGGEDKWVLEVVPGTPEPGADLENLNGAAAVPASSLVLAYVLVAAKAVKIEAADILNVATLAGAPGAGYPVSLGEIKSGEAQGPVEHDSFVTVFAFLAATNDYEIRASVASSIPGLEFGNAQVCIRYMVHPGKPVGAPLETMNFVVPRGGFWVANAVGFEEPRPTFEAHIQRLR
jgi:hypothetical protein